MKLILQRYESTVNKSTDDEYKIFEIIKEIECSDFYIGGWRVIFIDGIQRGFVGNNIIVLDSKSYYNSHIIIERN